MIIHLNGWPGVGKQTIGRIVAAQLNARFIHNHVLHDAAIACTGLRDPARWPLYEQVRSAAYQSLRQRARGEIFVMTNALCTKSQREMEAWGHVVQLAVERQVPLIPIVLEIEQQQNERRLQSTERIGRKMTDVAELRSFYASDTIHRPAVPELLVLDVTHLTPELSATAIIHHIGTLCLR